MRNHRKALGVGLIGSVVVILVSGFLAITSRDPYLVMLGYAFGLAAAYVTDRLNAPARESISTVDRVSILTAEGTKTSPEVWTIPASAQGGGRAEAGTPNSLADSQARGGGA